MRTETNTLAFTRVPCHQAELITLVKQSKAEQVTSWPTSTTPLHFEAPRRTYQR
ncbi:hypothetical protein HMPREF0970_01879 [Schaalia odontolytica F0309]|uniref:Uncharacterized protein n=1 Tax=Schaalia odontolytica F0309 TaxID=649742 RepID=D4U0Y5_9ACTO|nr:hypothetical protein HMPREF0970_01879 [Schaalia odontolytica F0309]